VNTDVSTPLVSVIMPSFNHERFVASAIASVLCQTMSNFELLIVDDGSRDRSSSIISNVGDKRVHYDILPRNGGACEAMNIALRRAKGRFVAVCNSDDEWHPDKLQVQLAIMENQGRVAAVFSDVVWVDEVGAPLNGPRAPPFCSVFRQPNCSRWMWMRRLLEEGNKLCHPSILIKREVYSRVGEYDNRLRQLPDLDMWVRVVSQGDIFVTPARLLRFRLHDRNTSAAKPDVSRRSINEHRFIVRRSLSSMSADYFARTFGLKALSVDDDIDFEIEKVLYLLGYAGVHYGIFREYGLDLLHDIFGSEAGIERLRTKYGLDVFAFQREMAVHSPWIAEPPTVGRIDAAEESAAQKLERFRSKDMGKVIIARYRRKIWRKLRRLFIRGDVKTG
jgi:glycosyltransferase involved in cell wall biosynthesis